MGNLRKGGRVVDLERGGGGGGGRGGGGGGGWIEKRGGMTPLTNYVIIILN